MAAILRSATPLFNGACCSASGDGGAACPSSAPIKAEALPLRARNHAALNAIASPKKGAVSDEDEDYGEAFVQADANPFADDDAAPAPAPAPANGGNNDGNPDRKPRASSSHQQHHPQQQHQHQHPHPAAAPRPDPKRRNPDDPSDGFSKLLF